MKMMRLVKRRILNFIGRPLKQRRYIDQSLGVTGFLEKLKDNNVNYVVLRWFEELPEVAPGEDIDILVADEDVELLTSFVNSNIRRKGIPCDIYSVGGLPGTNWRDLSYYPVPNARKILNNAVWLNGMVRVPSPDEHFLSMCYHAVYHKGYLSGIPSSDSTLPRNLFSPQDHDYKEELQKLFNRSSFKGSEFEMTLEGLDKFLFEKGWKPAYDTLEKLSKNNQWIYDVIISKIDDISENLKGVTLFLVREEGAGYLDIIKKCIFEDGFDHLIEGAVPHAEIQTIAAGIRGGDWGKGPWMKSGGLPVYYFVTFDSKPLVPNSETMKKHVGLYNARVLLTKQRIREHYNAGKLASEKCNIIHSTDNGAQAIEYLKLLDPDCLEYIQKETTRKCASFVTQFNVIDDLSKHARRAKVELIEFKGRKAVCKTFKEGRDIYLKREILAREVGKGVPEVSNILEFGDNYVVIDYCDSTLENISTLHPVFHANGFLPVWAINKIKNILVHYRSLGYECIDFSPQNILFDSRNGIKAIDFEFLQQVGKPLRTLKGNYAWYAVPAEFEGELPVGYSRNLYRRRWFSYTGLPLFFCVNDFPAYILHTVRFLAYCYFSINNSRRMVSSVFCHYMRSFAKYVFFLCQFIVRSSRKTISLLSQYTLRFR